jgi:Flp pilus assembly CpaE family ATPase
MNVAVVVAAGGAAWEARVLEEIGHSPALRLARRCLDLAEVLALAELCDVAVVSTELSGLGADAVMALERSGVRVVAVGDELRAHRVGISTVVEPGELQDVLAAGPGDHQVPYESDRGASHLTAVWGPHGAPGRSSIAASLACSIADGEARVFLVDADRRGGSLAQMFAMLDDVSGLVAACRSADRGRQDEIVDHTVPVDARLRVLTGVPNAEMWPQVRRGPFELVLHRLSERADHVIVDIGPDLDEHARLVLDRAHSIVVVGRADPVGLARLVRALHELQELRRSGAPMVAPVVVVNQLRSTSSWSRRDIDDALVRLAGVAPDITIDADYRALDTAAIRGVPPVRVAPNSPFVAGVGRLAEALRVLTYAH